MNLHIECTAHSCHIAYKMFYCYASSGTGLVSTMKVKNFAIPEKRLIAVKIVIRYGMVLNDFSNSI